jgi:hypothetical protein
MFEFLASKRYGVIVLLLVVTAGVYCFLLLSLVNVFLSDYVSGDIALIGMIFIGGLSGALFRALKRLRTSASYSRNHNDL